MSELRYKPVLSKPPKNGWHCVVDGYDFKSETREGLISKIRDFVKQAGIDCDVEREVELTFCRENPDQCHWGPP